MSTMKLTVSDELKRVVKQFPDVDWSLAAERAMWEKARRLKLAKSIASESKLSKEAALRLIRKTNKGLTKRYREMM